MPPYRLNPTHRLNGKAVGEKLSAEARFRLYFEEGEPDSCWEWAGYTREGYGNFMASGVTYRAHRFAWELAHGEQIPDGLNALHSCDNPPCVNPAHLFLGTTLDNNRDCVAKGRHAFNPNLGRLQGEDHPRARLTEQHVREIRDRYAAGRVSQQSLADEYGVTQPMIGYIVRRESWRHVA